MRGMYCLCMLHIVPQVLQVIITMCAYRDGTSTMRFECFVERITRVLLSVHSVSTIWPLLYDFISPFDLFLFCFTAAGKFFQLVIEVPVSVVLMSASSSAKAGLV